METKDDFLFSRNNSQSFVKDNYHFDNDNHYSNLILNQNYKILIPVQTLSKTCKYKNYGVSDNYDGNEKIQSLNKSSSNFSIFNKETEEFKKQWKKDCSKPNKSSTLSLHISAYKNSKNDKPIFADSTTFLIQNSFEFPRQQQNDEILEPEISHFKASQRLINPSEASNKIDQQDSSNESDEMEINANVELKVSESSTKDAIELDKLDGIEKMKIKIAEMKEEFEKNQKIEQQKPEHEAEIVQLKEADKLQMENLAEQKSQIIQETKALKIELEEIEEIFCEEKKAHEKEVTKLKAEIHAAKRGEKAKHDSEINVEILRSTNAMIRMQKDFEKKCLSTDVEMDESQKEEEDKEKLNLQTKLNELDETFTKLLNADRIVQLKDFITDSGHINTSLNENSIVIFKDLTYDGFEDWLADGRVLNLKSHDFQFCITKNFRASNIPISNVIEQIFYSNIKNLWLQKIYLTFSEYIKLVGACNIYNLFFDQVTVINEYGIGVDVADLLKELPNIETFFYSLKNGETFSCNKFAALPSFTHLQEIKLVGIEEKKFDLKIFGEFIKKNPTAKYFLYFYCSNQFYHQINTTLMELLPTLPSTCRIYISKC
uniref:Uncharacterized protein n=1 Tax=Panagrolaimus sp. PS1159 TaxID=55785 RepID=A0AC35F5T8_9BILA